MFNLLILLSALRSLKRIAAGCDGTRVVRLPNNSLPSISPALLSRAAARRGRRAADTGRALRRVLLVLRGFRGRRLYDVHELHNMRHRLTILAYEMNGAPVSVLHGAPLRLRCENELGFKMVKWIAAIEFVRDFADLGAGQGGYNEDHEFYGYRMPI